MDGSIFQTLTAGVHFDKKRRNLAAAPQQDVKRGCKEAGRSLQQTADNSAVMTIATNDPNEAANALRKRFRIKVKGGGVAVPPPLRAFSDMEVTTGCPPKLTSTLGNQLGCLTPTPIQRQAVPALLAGLELLAVAPTGSGKTLAYLLPILLSLSRLRKEQRARSQAGPSLASSPAVASAESKSKRTSAPRQRAKEPKRVGPAAESVDSEDTPGQLEGPQALVLGPTRELAAQIARVSSTLFGCSRLRCTLLTKSTAAGTDFSRVHLLVATPLLVSSTIGSGRLTLDHVRFLVLDEGDRLLDEQFVQQVDAVIAACTSPHLVRSLFSASLSESVEELARSMMHSPLRITVGERGAATASVAQSLQFVGSDAGRLLALRQAVAKGLKPPVLVFVSSKDRAAQLARDLVLDGIPADAITADQGQSARKTAIEKFRSGQTWMLVSTDLLARGIDFVLNTVVSYDLAANATDYIHRVGRTGRAGRSGRAVTYFTEDDLPKIKPIANLILAAGGIVPEFIRTTHKFERQPQILRKDKAK